MSEIPVPVAVPDQTAPLPVPPEWELTLAQLRAANEELQRRRADAEKDRELFRELYNRASAHAGDVARENSELLERAALAEGQVRDGLAMVRGTYDARVRRLEDEVDRLAKLNALLVAKDARTDADDLRRRAAEEANLRVDNQRLRAELAELRLDYGRVARLLEELGEKELEQLSEQEEEIKHRLDQPEQAVAMKAEIETETVVVSQTTAAP